MSRLLALFAFAIFAIFVGILGWKVPSLDLLLVIALTLVSQFTIKVTCPILRGWE